MAVEDELVLAGLLEPRRLGGQPVAPAPAAGDNERTLVGQMERMREEEQREAAADLNPADQNGLFHVSDTRVVPFAFSDLTLDTRAVLGVGSFAESVVRGVFAKSENDEDIRIDVAVKMMRVFNRRDGNNDRQGEAERRQEAGNTQRACINDNVVRLYGFVIDGLTCYMCMELMSATLEEIREIVHEKLPALTPAVPLDHTEFELFLGSVVVAAVDALSFLRNTARMMHRDIKPNNIMINERGVVKLCDFGESKRLQTAVSHSRAHTTGMGCIAYHAPEKFKPEVYAVSAGYGSKAEVWSLGISLVEVANGRYPYEGGNLQFLISRNIVENEAPRIIDAYSLYLRNFVDACLHKSEAMRASVAPPPLANGQPAPPAGNQSSVPLQLMKFYRRHAARAVEEREETVKQMLAAAKPFLAELRQRF